MTHPDIIERAKLLAHTAHDTIGQRRRYTNAPYWVHTDAVAQMIAEVVPNDTDMVVAAHLHDYLEDVTPKMPELFPAEKLREFGVRAFTMVRDLTDVYTTFWYPELNRKERTLRELLRYKDLSPEVKTIKLADIIDNVGSITLYDPAFAKVYLKEKMELLSALSDGSYVLYAHAQAKILSCMDAVKVP